MKITKEMRGDIVRQAVAYRFKDDEARITAARTTLADELYAHEFGAIEAQARAMPLGWVEYREVLLIRSVGYGYNWSDGEGRPKDDVMNYTLRLSKECPFPLHTSDVLVENGHPLCNMAQSILQTHRKMMRNRGELERKLWALLASCNTLKQLQAAWPEGEKFFPQDTKPVYAVVPVGLSDQINKALGLPDKADLATTAVRKAAL